MPSVGSSATDNRREALLRQIQQRRPGRPAPAAAGRAPDGAAAAAVPKAAELQKRKGLLRATKTRATSSARPGARPPSDSELLAGRQVLRSTAAQMAATDDSLAGIWAEFEHHDTNRDGVLDAQELAALFLSFGYGAVSDEYISSVLQEFGDGVAVGFEQFQQLWEMLAAHEADMHALLEALVNTDSNSHDREGVNRVKDQIEAFLTEKGLTTSTTTLGPGGDALHARLASGTGNRPVLMMGHMDTVFPTGEAAKRPFTVEDGIASGPGCADMKAGLVMNAFVMAAFAATGGSGQAFFASAC